MRLPAAILLTLVAALAACAASSEDPAEPGAPKVQVLETLPHDPGAFTQGLELSGGTLYEGTGLVGQSSVRIGPPGAAPVTRAELPAPLFGEGITKVGTSLWQLTWQNGVAVERDATTLAERRRVGYAGEGWGLCYQQSHDRLVMSDGSDQLIFRDPRTFAETGRIAVRDHGKPVTELNELECVGDTVYSNVWKTDTILRIDGNSGAVTTDIDASGLLTPAERSQADVLNGIAAVPGKDGEFLITGKLWPKMFRVRFP